MQDTDLPDPKPEEIKSPLAREEHLFRLLYGVTIFAILYTSIHKLWVPLFLRFTEVSQVAYQEINYWFLPAFLLLAHLLRKRQLGPVGSFLCGLLIVHGAWELWLIMQGKLVGWLQISHLLGSAPLALVSIAWLTMARKRSPKKWWGWVGAVVATFVIALPFFFGEPNNIPPSTGTSIGFDPGVPKLSDAAACGEKAFWTDLSEVGAISKRVELSLGTCGFQPALSRLDFFHGFRITNELDRNANIHILVYQLDGRKRGFNRILKSKESLHLHRGNFQVNAEEFVLLFSDALPESGASALFPNGQMGRRKVTRSPIGISSLDGVNE